MWWWYSCALGIGALQTGLTDPRLGFVSRLSNIKQSWARDTAKRHILKTSLDFLIFFSHSTLPFLLFTSLHHVTVCTFSLPLSCLCKLFPFPITLSFLSLFISLSLSESDWERHSVWIAASRSRLSPPADSTGLICLLFIKQIRRRGNENIIAIWFPARYFAYWFRADSGISSSHFFFFFHALKTELLSWAASAGFLYIAGKREGKKTETAEAVPQEDYLND